MAEIERGENDDEGAARAWTLRAVRAAHDPAWTADGYVSDRWRPVSPVTGRLDAFQWMVPVAALPSSAATEVPIARAAHDAAGSRAPFSRRPTPPPRRQRLQTHRAAAGAVRSAGSGFPSAHRAGFARAGADADPRRHSRWFAPPTIPASPTTRPKTTLPSVPIRFPPRSAASGDSCRAGAGADRQKVSGPSCKPWRPRPISRPRPTP